MADFAILDTSVWIEYFRGKNVPLCAQVESLIAERRLRQLHIIDGSMLANSRAILLRSRPQRRGRFSSRAWIAKAAIEHHCRLWSLDHHFQPIARHTSLQLFRLGT